MMIRWQPPILPNGPTPIYTIVRYSPAFNTPPQYVEKGTHFTGLNYYLFPPETIPQGVTFTGKPFLYLVTETRVMLDSSINKATSTNIDVCRRDEVIISV
jgi:hypothetical protein